MRRGTAYRVSLGDGGLPDRTEVASDLDIEFVPGNSQGARFVISFTDDGAGITVRKVSSAFSDQLGVLPCSSNVVEIR